MSCLIINSDGVNPWSKSAAIATASAAVITVLVCGILAVLAHQQIITSHVSWETLLIMAGAGGAGFGILSLAIRYVSCRQGQEENQGTTSLLDTNQKQQGEGFSPLSSNGKGPGGTNAGRNGGDNMNVPAGKGRFFWNKWSS